MAHDLLGSSIRRIGVALVGLATAATLVAGCSSSGNGKSPFTGGGGGNTSSNSGAGSTTPASGGGSTSSSSSLGNVGSGFLNGFCKDYATEGAKLSQDLANAGAGGNNDATYNAEITLFNKFASDGPSELKSSFSDIANALKDLKSGNYSALQTDAPKLSAAEQKITSYFASGCK